MANPNAEEIGKAAEEVGKALAEMVETVGRSFLAVGADLARAFVEATDRIDGDPED